MPEESTKARITNFSELRKKFIEQMRGLTRYYFVIWGNQAKDDYVTTFTDLYKLYTKKPSELKPGLEKLIKDRTTLLKQIKKTQLSQHPTDSRYVVLTFSNKTIMREAQGLLQLIDSTTNALDKSFTISKSDLATFCQFKPDSDISTLNQLLQRCIKNSTAQTKQTAQVTTTKIHTLNATKIQITTIKTSRQTFFKTEQSVENKPLLQDDQATPKCCGCTIL